MHGYRTKIQKKSLDSDVIENFIDMVSNFTLQLTLRTTNAQVVVWYEKRLSTIIWKCNQIILPFEVYIPEFTLFLPNPKQQTSSSLIENHLWFIIKADIKEIDKNWNNEL